MKSKSKGGQAAAKLLKWCWVLAMVILILYIAYEWMLLAFRTGNPWPLHARSGGSGGGSLIVEPTYMDFGEIPAGTELRADFKVTNGLNRRAMLSVQVPCNCMLETGKTELSPGETTSFRFKLPTAGWTGPIQEIVSVSIGTNPEENATVEIRGQAVEILEVTPKSLALGVHRHRRDAEAKVEVRTVDGKKLKVREAEVDGRAFVVSAVKSEKTDTALFRVSLRKDAIPGEYFGTLKLSIVEPRAITWSIPVIGKYTGEILAIPSELKFDQLVDGSWISLSMESRLENPDGKFFSITSAKVSDDRLLATVTPSGPSDSYLLRVTAKNIIAEDLNAIVTVTSDLGEDGILEIPVSITKPKAPPAVALDTLPQLHNQSRLIYMPRR